MINNFTKEGIWIPEQKLTKERKQICKKLLHRLGIKIDGDLKKIFENNTLPHDAEVRVLYKNSNDEKQELTFKHDDWDAFAITYHGSKLNNFNIYSFTYVVTCIWATPMSCGVYLSEDNRLYLPVPKTGVKRFIEADRIYIDEFVNF